MRNKLNAPLILGFLGLFSVATACGDDTGSNSPGNGAAGENGAGSGSDGPLNMGGGESTGSGGNPSGTGGDPSSSGGQASGSGGEPAGNAGQASGKGGEPSGNGGEPSSSGGNPSGNGGEASGEGGAGGSGPVTCTAITLGQFGQALVDPTFAQYTATFTPNVAGSGADDLRFTVLGPPSYDGDETGTFDLTENGDENYATCARCFLVVADIDGTRTYFFPSAGTVEIDATSKQLGGTIDATVTNLELVEVTIANDYTSTPVPNGACLTVASASIDVEAPECEGFECGTGYCIHPSYECDDYPHCADGSDEAPINASCGVPDGWLCPLSFIRDGDCDCGCGAQDPDCTSTTDESECDYCSECQNNFDLCADGQVDPADTTMCL